CAPTLLPPPPTLAPFPYTTLFRSRLVLTEPEPNMARQLRRRAERLGREVEIVEAPAEALPFEDASFDAVTGTLFLCTVGDPGRRSEEHTSELQSLTNLVCRLLLLQ